MLALSELGQLANSHLQVEQGMSFRTLEDWLGGEHRDTWREKEKGIDEAPYRSE